MINNWTEIKKYLETQKIDPELVSELKDFRTSYEVDDQVKERVAKPDILFYGKKILEMSMAALLQGDNLLLSGAKATGKNVLCETLSWLFGRPEYDISFHVNTDSADLIGTDTFSDNEVHLRKGPIYQCAEFGGFGILDEINMAKNDAVSVLHATLDHRRRIDIPGYNRISLHPATRFIGTMNYGYAGTRELNEALVSRFMVIDMPALDEPSLLFVLKQHFPTGNGNALKAFAGLFLDLQTKAYHGEISTKSLDLRGLVSAIRATRSGLPPIQAVQMGIINKSFDTFEKEIIEDVVSTRIPSSWTRKDIWG
ncbi:MAG TPA: MoxR family ATPase [Candidatus Blautia stercoripullorum]|uniref:MoxR family ATPase n=1 Tax=Candidatus Blautia stercoripullorum TaxID=2838502 RepID=A0A9D2R5X2_9FIRM|nr:MoxR family ATPase [Candidatus Blautia stercoripullorum]